MRLDPSRGRLRWVGLHNRAGEPHRNVRSDGKRLGSGLSGLIVDAHDYWPVRRTLDAIPPVICDCGNDAAYVGIRCRCGRTCSEREHKQQRFHTGIVKQNVLPCPAVDSTETVPPWLSITRLA